MRVMLSNAFLNSGRDEDFLKEEAEGFKGVWLRGRKSRDAGPLWSEGRES